MLTAAERYAIKVLVDRAMRNKLIADGVRAGHGARLHGAIKPGKIPTFTPARMGRADFPIADDEQLLQAHEIELGVATRGNTLPSKRRAA